MRYETILFDLDHCLLDSAESERLAFAAALGAVGLAASAERFATYAVLNGALWRSVEAGELTPNDVRHRRWEAFVAEVGVDANPLVMSEAFVQGLGSFGELYPGATEVLSSVSTGRRLGLVTNGIGSVQRMRIDRLGLENVFDAIVISGEVDVAKPDPRIFELTAEKLGGVNKSTTLMIGDSLTSDVAGGKRFGIDTCWVNVDSLPVEQLQPTHEVRSLGDVLAIV